MPSKASEISSAPKIEPGISASLAAWRSKHYRDVRYALDLALHPGSHLTGRVQLSLSLGGAATDLILDWRGGEERVSALEVNGQRIERPDIRDGHIVIPSRLLQPGRNTVSYSFSAPASASGGPLTRYVDPVDGAEYWYTLFVPADASSVFPCFDQPDLKARFTATILAPDDWRVVTNAPLLGSRADAGSMRHRFEATEPISTYLFAFAAGPFETILESGARASPGATRLLVRRSKLDQARTEAPAVLDLNRRAMRWFSRYFERPFPFAKYDLVLIPELAYGGMEHAGATFLREESVLFPFQPSSADRLRRAQLVLHETAHQWFGDLVTMRWFDDLWLKEGFANFMAAKASAALLGRELPDIDPWIAFNAVKTAAYRTDATEGTTPIWQAMNNLDDAKSAYGNIVYSKAPAVLRQAEFFVGEKPFRQAVRDFLARHAYGAASWSDLVSALEKASGQSLTAWASAWVRQRGMPRVRVTRKQDGQATELLVTQEPVLAEGGRWPMRLRVVALPSGSGAARRRDVRLTDDAARVRLPTSAAPALVFANDGDFGYGQFLLDPESEAFALEHIGEIAEPLLRALIYGSLWESVREARLDPARYIALVMGRLPAEQDELTGSLLLSRLAGAFLRYLPPSRRSAMEEEVERFVWTELQRASSVSRRIALFRAFADIARSPSGRDRLKALLDDRERIEGVPLRSVDRFRLIGALIAARDPEGPARLKLEAERDPSGEGRRYAFGASAANADVPLKRTLFRRFVEDAALPESWIEEALGPFNELDQSSVTREFLEPALALLPTLKRERRIFFVNHWLAAFIGGQSSADALAAAQRFARQPGLDQDLRLKVLEAIDPLERTVRIRAAFP